MRRSLLVCCLLLGLVTLAWPQTVHHETVIWDFVNGLMVGGQPVGGGGSTDQNQVFISAGPGSGVWTPIPNAPLLGYNATTRSFVVHPLGGGGGGSPSVGTVGTLQVADGAAAFAAYGGSGICAAGFFMTQLTATGAAVCRATTLTARPLLAQGSSEFPNGINLSAQPSGLVQLTTSGGVATPFTVAAPTGPIVGTTDSQELTNKRVTYRLASLPTNVSPLQVNVGLGSEGSDLFVITDLLQNTHMAAPLGSAKPGQIIFFQTKTTVTRALTWDPAWSADAGYPLPTTISSGGYDFWLFQYNATSGKWAIVYNSQTIRDIVAPVVSPGSYFCPTLGVTAQGRITSIANGTCGTGAAQSSLTLTLVGTANEVQVTGGTQDLSANRTWTMALPATLNLAGHTLMGGTPLVFDGATAGSNATTVVVTDPTAARTFTIPDANSVAVQPDAGTANQFVTAVSTLGVLSKAQPSTTSLSDGGALVKNNAPNTFSGAGTLTGLPTPSAPTDAATKGYVDSVATGLSPRGPVRVATTANLTATYANGTLGVGATLTNNGTLAALTIDGVALASTDRVLVKNQSAGLQNGIYTVTNIGSGAVSWVLTRATDYDESAEVGAGTYTNVGGEGTANKNTLWVQSTTGTITMGTTAMVFSQLGVQAAPFTSIPDNTVMDNKIKATAVAPPSTPPAGFGYVYFDSSSKTMAVKDDAGVVKHGAQTVTATGSQWLRSMDDAGLFTKSQPAFADLTGVATAGQVPNLENQNGTLTTAKGGTGFTDTTYSGTSHKLATVSGTFAAGNCTTTDASGNFISTGIPCGTGTGGVPTTRTLTLTGTANEVTVTGASQDLSADRTWTVALPATLSLGGKTLQGGTPLVFDGATPGGSATSLIITDPTGPRSLTIPDADSVTVRPDAGTANQFVTALSALGVLTKAQPSTANLSDGSTLVKTNTPNTFSGAGTLTGLPTPATATDAATKGYVDALTSGLSGRAAVRATTTVALTASYSNGTGGVGATLTNTGTLAALVLDGVALVIGDRVLVKDQAAPAQNGIYTVTTVGTGAVAWLLTRATDYDQAAEVASGSYTLVGPEGTSTKNTMWIQSTPGTITMGTTALVFNQLGAQAPPLTNIPDNTVLDNKIKATAVSAPSTPPAGFGYIYLDSSSKTLAVKDDSGVVKHGVQTIAALSSQWLTSVNDAGLFVRSQPAFSDLTGQATAGQVPNLENHNGTLPRTNGGTGWTDTTVGGTTHTLATESGSFTAGHCLTKDATGNIVSTGAACGAGGGGGATPAGVTQDVQFNNAGTLAVDTGDFTYNPNMHSLMAPHLQTGRGYVPFQDVTGRQLYLMPPSNLTTDRSIRLPDEDGTLCVKGGTCFAGGGSAPAGDDQVLVSDSTSASTWRTIPNCTDAGGSHLNYTAATNTWSCGTSSSGGVPGDAAADGTTKGIAAFTAADFNAAAGVISLDYTNAQAATGSVKGFLTAADWTTFNAKVGTATSDTLTFKTLDVEASGNVITTVSKVWLPVAGCQGTTAGLLWDSPASNAAVAACVTGTNTQKGVADFADGSNLSLQITTMLPSDWTGAIDARFKWLTPITTGSVVWQIATACVADAETDDPAFNTASVVIDAAKGTTNQTNDATITGVTTTGCAAGELLHIKVFRDSAHASDDLAGTARLIGVELTLRRAQ